MAARTETETPKPCTSSREQTTESVDIDIVGSNIEFQQNTSTCVSRGALRADRCHFYLDKKRRYCRNFPYQGSNYCVEHSHMLKTDFKRKRISCPLDQKHTCYEDQLDKHLKKCNARQGENLEYYTQNINLGTVQNEEELEKISIISRDSDEIMKMVEKVKQVFREAVSEPPEVILFHEALREETEKCTNGLPAQKHLHQQASLIGHLDRAKLLEDGKCYIEFGAGRGGLSHWVQMALEGKEDTQFLLVERGGVRYKKDTYHKYEGRGPKFERLRIDIQHLNLGKVRSLQESSRPIVGIGKHLCGGATDLMLRCLMETSSQNISELEGIVLALCCHHRCDWQTYVGKQFFLEQGLTARDFHLFCSMTSWATCATRVFLNKLNDVQVKSGMSESVVLPGHQVANNKQEETKSGTSEFVVPPGHQVANNKQEETKSGMSEFVVPPVHQVANNKQEETKSGMCEVVVPPAHQVASEDEEYSHPKYGRMTPEEREEIGYQCKKIIDMGRVHYLRNHNYFADLVCYTNKSFSLENVALIVTKHDMSHSER